MTFGTTLVHTWFLDLVHHLAWQIPCNISTRLELFLSSRVQDRQGTYLSWSDRSILNDRSNTPDKVAEHSVPFRILDAWQNVKFHKLEDDNDDDDENGKNEDDRDDCIDGNIISREKKWI